MSLIIWLSIALLISVSINVVLFRLSQEQSEKLFIISENMSDLMEMLKSFQNHLKTVYELEAFYGDETLEFLLKHAISLNSILEQQYGDITNIADPIEYEIITEEEQNEQKEEYGPKEKHVFYAGARRRDN